MIFHFFSDDHFHTALRRRDTLPHAGRSRVTTMRKTVPARRLQPRSRRVVAQHSFFQPLTESIVMRKCHRGRGHSMLPPVGTVAPSRQEAPRAHRRASIGPTFLDKTAATAGSDEL